MKTNRDFPFKFKQANIGEISGAFHAEITIPDDKAKANPGLAARLSDPLGTHFGEGLKKIDAAWKQIDGTVEKFLKDAEKLDAAGKKKEAVAKVQEASKLSEKAKLMIQPTIDDINQRAKTYIDTLWANEVKKDARLRDTKIVAVCKATFNISLGAAAALAGVGVAVVSHGGAIPIAAAAVGGGISLMSTAFTSVSAALKGFDSAYLGLCQAYDKAVIELEKSKLKAEKPDKNTKDKVKAFFASNPIKAVDAAFQVYAVKVREAEKKIDSYGAEVQKLLQKQDALNKAIAQSNDKAMEAQAKKLAEQIEYLLKKNDFLTKKMAMAKAEALNAEKLIADAKNGNLGKMGGKILSGLGDVANSQEFKSMETAGVAVGKLAVDILKAAG